MRIQQPNPPKRILPDRQLLRRVRKAATGWSVLDHLPEELDVHIIGRFEGGRGIGDLVVSFNLLAYAVQPVFHVLSVMHHVVVRMHERRVDHEAPGKPLLERVSARQPGFFAVWAEMLRQGDELTGELLGDGVEEDAGVSGVVGAACQDARLVEYRDQAEAVLGEVGSFRVGQQLGAKVYGQDAVQG